LPDDAGRLLKGHFLTQALNMQNVQNIQEGLPIIKHGLSFSHSLDLGNKLTFHYANALLIASSQGEFTILLFPP